MGNGIWVWGRQPSQKHSGTPVLLLPPETHLPPFLQCLPCPFLLLTTSCPAPPRSPSGVHQGHLGVTSPSTRLGVQLFPLPACSLVAAEASSRGAERRKGGRGLGSREPLNPHPHAFPLPWKG